MRIETAFIEIGGKRLEARLWQRDAAPQSPFAGTLVLLHEALGSVAYWKDFPEKLALATGYDVLAYSRAGHGESEGPVDPRSVAYYEQQIDTVLPAMLAHFSVARPVLYGHSEGATIALLYAAKQHPVIAVIAECPILVSEERTSETIQALAAGYATTDMRSRLGKYHRDADSVFHSWIAGTRSTLLKDFPMSAYLARVRCPVLALQGARDEFGSIAQYQALKQAIPSAEHVLLDAGHLLHREEQERVVESVHAFLSTVNAFTVAVPNPL